MEIYDHGKNGSILLEPGSSLLTGYENKLYNVNSNLYWNGLKLGTSTEAAGWILDGLNLYTDDLSTKVGIGTNTPLFPFHVEGTSVNDITLALNNQNNRGFTQVLFGSNASEDGSILFFGPTHLGSSDKFRFKNNRVGGLFDWYIDENLKMSLNSNGLLDVVGSLKIGDDGVTHSAGTIRYNTISQEFEGYNGIGWNAFGGVGKWSANGSDIYYNNGYAGIGLTTPLYPLHVQGDGIEKSGYFINNNTTGFAYAVHGVSAGSNANTNVGLYGQATGDTTNIGITGLAQNGMKNYGGYFTAVSSDTNYAVYATVNTGTTKYAGFFDEGDVIVDNGDLGIGITAPQAKTHILQESGGGVDAFRVDDETNDVSPFIILEDGNVGVGLTTPVAKTHIVQLNSSPAFQVDDESSDNSPFIIDEDGNVGIGTLNPTENFEFVDGNYNVQMGDTYTSAPSHFNYVSLAARNTDAHALLARHYEQPIIEDLYYGISVSATSNEKNYAIHATASGGTSNYAGYFDGDVVVTGGNLGIGITNPTEEFHFADSHRTVKMGEFDDSDPFSSSEISLSARNLNTEALIGVYTDLDLVGFDDEYYGMKVSATSNEKNYAIHATASGGSSNYAGYFVGDVNISGNLSKSGGSFKIDHPLDPENKYLYHSFVESPDMMNVYNGNVTTGSDGYASVDLPLYFEALNKDFKYQLTVIGEFAQAIISKKIVNNQFEIRTDKPNIEVSWQVTGIRKDAYAEKNRIQVEVDKERHNQGTYLNPEVYGKSITKKEGYREEL